MNRHYFVDVENVGTYWTKLFEGMTDSDLMYLYTSENTKITYGVLIPYMHDTKWDQLEIKETIVMCKKDNNLDCFLLSDLNTKMKQDKGLNVEYFIVSKDKGYDKYIEAMLNNGYKVTRICQEEAKAEICKKSKVEDKKEIKEKKETKKDTEKLKKEIADQLRACVIKKQGKKNHFENAFNYDILADIYIKEKKFEKVLSSIKDKTNAERFSSFVNNSKRKAIEKLIEKNNL